MQYQSILSKQVELLSREVTLFPFPVSLTGISAVACGGLSKSEECILIKASWIIHSHNLVNLVRICGVHPSTGRNIDWDKMYSRAGISRNAQKLTW